MAFALDMVIYYAVSLTSLLRTAKSGGKRWLGRGIGRILGEAAGSRQSIHRCKHLTTGPKLVGIEYKEGIETKKREHIGQK